MNKLVIATVTALVGGCLCAQAQEGQLPKPNTWTGTLVDSGCRSSGSPRQKTASDPGSYRAGTPTSYALITADGKCIPFDVNSNEKVMGLFKINSNWRENTVKIKPTQVEVVGTEQNGKILVDDIRTKQVTSRPGTL